MTAVCGKLLPYPNIFSCSPKCAKVLGDKLEKEL